MGVGCCGRFVGGSGWFWIALKIILVGRGSL